MSEPFKFKQFTVAQDRCAMKVGTDGVLLGAWASLERHPESILDIGSGTGIIALQLAQRSQAGQVDALEIDPDAYEQCVENFENSRWNDRLFCYHASLQEFAEETEEQYDLIVSNPPFYDNHYNSGDLSRNTARSVNSLPFEELLRAVDKLLSPDGTFSLILPFQHETTLLDLAVQVGFHPRMICRVKGNPKLTYKRSLICLCRERIACEEDEMTIEIDRHVYTEKYSDLVRDFYLKM